MSLIANGGYNNGGFGELPFTIGRYTGVIRWAHDVRPNLKSNAYTGIYTRSADPDDEDPSMQDELIFWSASANVEYTGEEDSNEGEYVLSARILNFRQGRIGAWDGELDKNVGFYIEMSPPPDDVAPDIDDCKASGYASIKDLAGREIERTYSRIPF